LKRNFNTHREFEGGEIGDREVGGDFEEVCGAGDVELGVATLRALAGVAENGDARADAEGVYLGTERDDLADGFMAGLAGTIRVSEGLAGKHRLSV
jgi:hypothetical protein